MYDMEMPSKERVIELLLLNPNNVIYCDYETAPSILYPYFAGSLTSEFLEVGINRVNMFREMLGLYPMELTNEANNYAQHAALIGKINKRISHWPTQPLNFDDELYELCSFACLHSNLAGPYYPLKRSIDEYMFDHHLNNLGHVGHRRNLMKPNAKYIGIGQVWDYNAIYIYDASYGVTIWSYDTIAYPATNSYMPLNESFWRNDTPWSITFNKQFFIVDINNLTITITKDNEVLWTNHGELPISDNINSYMICEGTYGWVSPCIIFKPYPIEYSAGEYIIYIDGLKNKQNKPIDFKYKVNMFNKYEYGDSNMDGNIDAVDALLTLRYTMGLISTYTEYMDINRDHIIDAVDALLILRKSMGF